ncbi:amidase [Allosediminivita pacifica]|uniref:Aspartyl-tRNA(Asn)/glutamyl-tRNA(Gln) amidotransferase subunit A n=1 Tax=Allosediminivita pacifica TaxID=1267769 RepID=A0A2T6AJ79_9RHOB|nr:amidase [Allosediminivita pacifica]PTX43857.1 aspartyl-tRNA(Asn)/glutamyl-tRNA(Gln) amidotransferase subunit A [Allosediminivita pacifica]GGB22326.1 amidase [Allosediminivita pacifica]
MQQIDPAELNATDVARLFRSGELTPSRATRMALDRIERFNDAVNAFVLVDEERAMEDATAADARWAEGKPLSEVDGMPVSVKDLTNVKGWPSRGGSLLSSEEPAEVDAPPARRLREAGAVMLGKTNTPEFGWKGVTDNRVFGATRNPWNTDMTPGGSSGGAAVAAALNMGWLHQGGDSGGSIRIPASFTGVFGFKPTFGWTPTWPPSNAATLSHIGPLTRTVEDAVMMLNVIGRYDHVDPYATRGTPEDWGVDLGKGLDGLRIAFAPGLGGAEADPEVLVLVERAADRLRALGAEVVETSPEIESPIDIFQKIWFTASLDFYDGCTNDECEKLDPGLVDNAMRARECSALDLYRALARRAELTQTLEAFNQNYHLLMTPSVAVPPFAANRNVPEGSGMTDWTEWSPFSYPFNLSQQPAASVPCGFTESGLPVGFQLAGGMHDDVRVLRACKAYMDAHPEAFPDAPKVH